MKIGEGSTLIFRTIFEQKKVINKSYVRSIIYIFVFVTVLVIYKFAGGFWVPVLQKITGKRTVEDIIDKYGDVSRSRLKERFSREKVDYPPQKITFLALKKERQLELWASNGEEYKLIVEYQILKTSGFPGPKLKEGDRQVPEGKYGVVGLNPNSSYHLSIKLNYPNSFDLFHAEKDGRTQPGSDIFIHGKDVSVGCLAMGDQTIEDLFVLVHDVGKRNVQVVISPHDPRTTPLDATSINGPEWLIELYEDISQEFNKYRKTAHEVISRARLRQQTEDVWFKTTKSTKDMK